MVFKFRSSVTEVCDAITQVVVPSDFITFGVTCS